MRVSGKRIWAGALVAGICLIGGAASADPDCFSRCNTYCADRCSNRYPTAEQALECADICTDGCYAGCVM